MASSRISLGLGEQGQMGQVLGPLHPCGQLGRRSSWLWLERQKSGCHSHMGSESAQERLVSLFLAFSITCLSKKINQALRKKRTSRILQAILLVNLRILINRLLENKKSFHLTQKIGKLISYTEIICKSYLSE